MKTSIVSKSVLTAGGVALAAAVWMLTGVVSFGGSEQPVAEEAADREPTRVTVRDSRAQPIMREIVVSARTEPNRSVQISAETEGRIVELGAERGTRVEAGDLITALDMRDREARIAQAEALVAQRELEYEAARQLEGRQLVSDAEIARANAELVSARAELERARLDVAYTRIAAPFEGVLEERDVELGDYVGIGDTIATVVDVDPLIVVGDVSEREVGPLDVGSTGSASLLGGKTLEGTIRYVAPVASDSTRTFRVELAIPNPDAGLRAGMTAEVRLPTAGVEAHQLSPGFLTLDSDGNVGVKLVDALDVVRFHPVQIVRSGAQGVWVEGLPEEVRVITVGQGFVADGEQVVPVVDPDMVEYREHSSR